MLLEAAGPPPADSAISEQAPVPVMAECALLRKKRTAELANRISSLLRSSLWPRDREPRCARRSDDTEAVRGYFGRSDRNALRLIGSRISAGAWRSPTPAAATTRPPDRTSDSVRGQKGGISSPLPAPSGDPRGDRGPPRRHDLRWPRPDGPLLGRPRAARPGVPLRRDPAVAEDAGARPAPSGIRGEIGLNRDAGVAAD
jgi:hypothetical protein